MRRIIIYTILLGNLWGCQSQNKKTMNNNNPLLCNPETGLCEIPTLQDQTKTNAIVTTEKPIKIIYFTDPICSSCWGIEPQLRKLKLEYGEQLEIEYRMGGLLPDWSYNSGGINKSSDVAHHWDEVSHHYDMPIDGDIWLEDPLNSSYPPSIAYKAAELQDKKKAILFMREIREMVFLHKKNIARWENLEQAAKKVQLDLTQFKKDYEGKAKELFNTDLEIAKNYSVRGFPTFIFINKDNQKETIYGSQPYTAYEKSIQKLAPSITKKSYIKSWEFLFSQYNSMTAKEFSELSETPRNEAEKTLNKLTEENILTKFKTKNGSIWTLK